MSWIAFYDLIIGYIDNIRIENELLEKGILIDTDYNNI